jgi:urease accessory protein
MTWHAELQLDYLNTGSPASPKTGMHFLHKGPLRVLQSMYPEGDAVCHNVLVHPPGGVVGGDSIDIGLSVGPEAHGLVTTPGATRFYRSAGQPGRQDVKARLAPGARLEWLPMEGICYSGCNAINRAMFDLAPGAEMLGWDVMALGLPGANEPFVAGTLLQHIELPGLWLERARIDATDLRLLDGPVGLGGQRCMGSLFFAAGTAIERGRREAMLEAVREVLAASDLAAWAGATSPNPNVVVVRTLSPMVEPTMKLLRQCWASFRRSAWDMPAVAPRSWAM